MSEYRSESLEEWCEDVFIEEYEEEDEERRKELQNIIEDTHIASLKGYVYGVVAQAVSIDYEPRSCMRTAITSSINYEKLKASLKYWFSNNVCECCGMIIGNEIDNPCTA